MVHILGKIADLLESINEKVGNAVSWLTAILVVTVFVNALLRYAFSNSQIWLGELSWHLFSLVFLLAAGYTLKHNRHVRVDVFYSRLSLKKQALIDLLGMIIFLIPVCLMVITSGWEFAARSFRISERSAEANGLPALYIIKFAIVAGFVLLLIQAVGYAIRSILTLIKPQSPSAV